MLPFLFHWKLFSPNLSERKIFRGDFLNQHYVWKSYVISRVKSGELPLWNPHVLGGVPFHANPQAGIFYPPTYFLLLFENEGVVNYTALEAYQLLHQIFGGLGIWLFMCSLGIGNLGSLFASVIFMFTGFFTTPGHHAIIVTASWIPWTFYAVKCSQNTNAITAISTIALALSGLVLAGHPQITYYGLILAGLWTVYTLGIWNGLKTFTVATALCLLVSAVQVLPTYELAKESSRSDLGYEYSTSFGFSPYFLSAAFVPRGQIRLPGQEGAAPFHIYVGIGTLMLAAIGLLLATDKWRLFFAIAATLSLFLSFGKDSPLFDWFYATVPGFERFRVPYRLLGIYTFSIAVLSGIGLQVLTDAQQTTRVRLKGIAKTSFVVLLFLSAWAAYLHTSVTGPSALPPEQIETVVGNAYWSILLGITNLLLLMIVLWRPIERWAIGGILLIGIIDIGAFVKDRGQHPYSTLVRSSERFAHLITRTQSYLSRHVSESNLENYSMIQNTNSIGGHTPLVDSHYSDLLGLSKTSANVLSVMNAKFIDSRSPISKYPWCGPRFASPLPILDLQQELTPAHFGIQPPIVATHFRLEWQSLTTAPSGTIELQGKTHIIGNQPYLEIEFEKPEKIAAFTITLDKGSDNLRLNKIEVDLNPIGLKADFLTLNNLKINLHTLPRAYFVVPSPNLDNEGETQKLTDLKCWTVHQGVTIQTDLKTSSTTGFFRNNAAKITTYEPERVVITTNSPRAGYLVLTDTLRPGWIATVDKKEVPILRAQWFARAVSVPQGEHTVEFIYRPRSLSQGLSVTILSVVILSFLLSLPHIRQPSDANLSS